MIDNTTPEKDLLRIIEGEKSSSSADVKPYNVSYFNLPKIFTSLIKKIKDRKLKEIFLDFKFINFFLLFVNFILVLYLIYTLVFSYFNLKKDFSPKIIEKIDTPVGSLETSRLKPLGYYLDTVKSRNIFVMNSARLNLDNLSEKSPSSKAIEATKNLKLVGISWGPDPDVIIEDTLNKRTLFLKRGQLIDNKIRVKSIFKDKVILRYGGEDIELR
jgi:type II secretory pathway component PulC